MSEVNVEEINVTSTASNTTVTQASTTTVTQASTTMAPRRNVSAGKLFGYCLLANDSRPENVEKRKFKMTPRCDPTKKMPKICCLLVLNCKYR